MPRAAGPPTGRSSFSQSRLALPALSFKGSLKGHLAGRAAGIISACARGVYIRALVAKAEQTEWDNSGAMTIVEGRRAG